MWSETLFSYFGRQRGKPLSKLKTRTECLNILSNPVRESLAENSVTQHPFSPNTLLLVCPVEFLAEDLVLLLLAFRISMCSPTVEEIRESPRIGLMHSTCVTFGPSMDPINHTRERKCGEGCLR